MMRNDIFFVIIVALSSIAVSTTAGGGGGGGGGERKMVYGLKKPSYHDDDDPDQCTVIREPVCQGLQYSDTKMPNWVKMTSQEEAAKRMIDYMSLLNVNCSHYLKLFLCTIYFPMCTPVLEQSALKPCKSLCLHVRKRCEPLMQQFQFNWPAELSCDQLPQSPALCVAPEGYTKDAQRPVLPMVPGSGVGGPLVSSLERMYPQLHELLKRKHAAPNLDSLIQAAAAIDGSVSTETDNQDNSTCSPAEFSLTQVSNDTSCFTHCNAHLLYKPADKVFARAWLLGWSIICMFSAALTFLTVCLDRSRLQYPERPVLFLAACYFATGFGYILQFALGAERVTCRSLRLSEGNSPDSPMYLLTGGQEGTWCTVGFLISYYFGMASNFWWVMLSLCWYLSTSRRWSHEGVASVSSVFHMFSWALPAIQAIVILILHKIDADELTGTCYTGFHSETALLLGVLLPRAFCLLLGLGLLSVGFAAIFQVRRKLKSPNCRERESRRRLEKSIVKVGVFAVLYTLPMACLLAGQLYEYLGQSKWLAALQRLHTTKPHCLSPRGVDWTLPECHPVDSPSFEATMLRIFMSLVVGITSGMWVWANKKTLKTFTRVICKGSPREPVQTLRGLFEKPDDPPIFASMGVFSSAPDTSASIAGVSPSTVGGCPMCASPTDLSNHQGLEKHSRFCHLHSNAPQQINFHRDHLFHLQQQQQQSSNAFQNNAAAFLRHPTAGECV